VAISVNNPGEARVTLFFGKGTSYWPRSYWIGTDNKAAKISVNSGMLRLKLLTQGHERVHSLYCTIALLGRRLASTAAYLFQFRATSIALNWPRFPEALDVGVIVVDVTEAFLIDISQDHGGMVANANISRWIYGEIRVFSG
jgi:hypothetical protein